MSSDGAYSNTATANNNNSNGIGVTRVPTRYRRRAGTAQLRSSSERPPPKPKLQVETALRQQQPGSSSSASATPLSAYSTPLSGWSFEHVRHPASNPHSDTETPPLDRNPFENPVERVSRKNNLMSPSPASSIKEEEEEEQSVNNPSSSTTVRKTASSGLRRSHTHHKSNSQTKVVGGPKPTFPLKIQLPTQTIAKDVSPDTRIADLLDDLVQEHRYELASAEDYMLWEVVEACGIKRPIRPYEYVKFIKASWENVTNNYLQIGPSSKRLDVDSTAFLAPRRDLYNSGKAFFRASMAYLKPGHLHEWRKGWVDVTNSHLVVRKREHGSEVRSLNITEFELYEYRKSKLASLRTLPGKYMLILRSQQSPDFFLNKGDALLFLSTNSRDDHDNLRNIVYSLRTNALDKSITAYTQSLETPEQDTTQHKNLLNIHQKPENTSSSSSPAAHVTKHDNELESIPLAQLQLENQEIKKDGLLGSKYDNMLSQQVSNPNAVEHAKFTPNSLLANSKASANADGAGVPILTEDQSPFERGLMGRAYSVRRPKSKPTKRLPSHSLGTAHKI